MPLLAFWHIAQFRMPGLIPSPWKNEARRDSDREASVRTRTLDPRVRMRPSITPTGMKPGQQLWQQGHRPFFLGAPEMRDVLAMTDRLKAEFDRMRAEHKEFVATLQALVGAAKEEGELEYVRFAEKLMLHAETEEDVLYPAAILVGDYVRAKLGACRMKGPESIQAKRARHGRE